MTYLFYDKCMWWRISPTGFGFSIRNTPLLFSERYGHRKYLKLPLGYRLSILESR